MDQLLSTWGDGIMVRFGYPRAHEDDAERAVRCSLEIISALVEAKTPDGSKLEVRIGIATGLVVVGDQLGFEPTEERSAVGETPNLAGRSRDAMNGARRGLYSSLARQCVRFA